MNAKTTDKTKAETKQEKEEQERIEEKRLKTSAGDTNVEQTDEQAPKTKMTSVIVDITKDPMMKPSLRVFEHEIPILEVLHGPDNVNVREDTAREDEFEGTAESEYSRLETRFGRAGQAALRHVYPSPRDLASEAGIKAPAGRKRVGSRNASKDVNQSRQRGKKEN